MKKMYTLYQPLLVIALLLHICTVKAQVSSYTFSQSGSTYTPVGSGGTRQTSAEGDEGGVAVSLPFTFNFNGTGYTSVAASTNGFIQMGTAVVNGAGAAYVSASNSNGQIISSSTAGTFNTIAALNYDLTSIATFTVTGNRTNGNTSITGCAGANFTATKVRPGMGISGTGIPSGTYITAVNIGLGTITLSAAATSGSGTNTTLTISTGLVTTTTGVSPNRVFTVQWSGRKRYNVAADDMDFQINLYETTNVIEVYYNTVTVGTASVTGTDDLAQVGLKGAANTDFNNRVTNTSTAWSASTAGGTNASTCLLSAAVKPAAGQLYRWTPPPCMASIPSGLGSSSVLSTTATISWTAASPAPASGYEYYISASSTPPTGATTATGTTAAGVVTANLTGLSSATQYYFWVRGNCGSGNKSGWAGSATFTTACVNSTLPYPQGFNATTIPTCWTQQYVTGTSAVQFVASSTNPTILTPQEGADYVYWNSYSITSGNQTRLVSPAITTTGSTTVNARFYWYHDNSAYTTAGYADEGVKLQYSLNGTTWTDVQTINRLLPGTDGWTLYDISLPAGAGNVATMYVGFLFTSRAGDNCALDNLLVYAPSPCSTPTDPPLALALTSVTSTTLSGSFTAASPAPTGYIVLRSTSGTTPSLINGTTYNVGSSYTLPISSYTVVSSGSSTSFTQTGLNPNTTYYYYVFSYNSSCAGQPYYLTASFTSASAITCTAASATLTGTTINSSSATINFSAITGASSYILQYSVAGSNAWITASPAPVSSPYTLTGLTSGTAYDIRIEGPNSSCGTVLTTSNAFTTTCTSFSLPYTQGFEGGTTIPACWTQQYVSGTKAFSYGSTTTAAGTTPNPTAASGSNRLLFPSYSNNGNQTRFYSPVIVTTGTASVDVSFQWYFSSNGGSGSYTTEGVQVQWSTNGSTWNNTGSLIRRYGATDGWQKQILTLPAGAGNQAVLYVGFLFTSNAGYDSYMDDIVIKATPPCNYAGTSSASTNTICGGSGSAILYATDYSVSGAGLAYNWQMSTDNVTFNDISGATNPATYTTPTISATRYYRLRVFCTSLGNSYTTVQTINVGSYSILTTTAATRCGVGTVTLNATATVGATISWYDVSTGGTSIGTGSSFTTPEISATTNYYVGANNGVTAATIGATYSGSGTNSTNVGSHGIVITTTSPNINIISAKIPFTGKGTFTIQLQTTGGVVVTSVTTPEITGGGSIPVTVPLNIAVSTPGTYRLLITAITGTIDDLGYISTASYPYTGLGGAFSVTAGYWYGNDANDNMYLFSLQVTNICESARTLVAATVTPPPALTINPASATICSGSNTSISVTTPASNFVTYSWSPATGVTASGSPSGTTVTLNPTTTTNYTLTATSASNCVNKITTLITVNAAPPTTTGAAVCSGTNATISATSSCTNYGNPTLQINGNYDAAVDPVAPRPIIYIANSPTCNFDPAVIRNYTVQNFQVTVTGTYTFVMPNTTAFDGMGYIVTGAFVPGTCPGAGTWIVGDDDSGPTIFEPFMSATLTAGTTYTLITTTYDASSGTYTGPYTWNITGPVGGAITTVSGGTLQWYTVASGGSSISSASPFNPVGVAGSGVATNTSVGSYTFYAACSNNPTCRTATGYVIGASGQWVGTTSTDWSTITNWCGGVPTISSDATVSLGPTNMPLLSSGTGTVRNITINTGATLTVSNATMQIAGTITASNNITASAGTIELAGSSAQAISGSSFTGRSIRNLIASNSVNVSSAVGDSLKITGVLSFGASSKTFASGDNVILVSNATGTARVADITNNGALSGNSFTGKFVVQRYIPARRAWRLLTAPITAGAQTINQAWQEGVGGTWSSNPAPGYGTHISGGPARTTAQGYDQGPNLASIAGYTGTGWGYLPTTTSDLVSSREGWLLFVRGSRSINLPLSTPATIADITTLRPKGTIRFGTQPTITNATGGFTVIGNPYPAPINFKTINKTGVIGGMGGNNAYTLWDPNLAGSSGVGAFVTFSWNSGTSTYDKNIVTGSGTSNINNNGMIPSGSAFLINQSAGGTITIAEKDKDTVVYATPYLFRPLSQSSSIRLSLYLPEADGTKAITDGALITFSEQSDNAVDVEDAVKLPNIKENFAITKEGQRIAIERRNLLNAGDTLFYKMWNMRQKNYVLELALTNMTLPAGEIAYLEDVYLNTKTPLNFADTTTIEFSVTADAASANEDRFRIIMAASTVVPVTFTNIKAYQLNSDIMVEWNVENEINIADYEVEKSADGTNFTSIGVTQARGGNNIYTLLDEHALQGANYYKVKSIDNTGHVIYSRIVKVIIGKGKPAIAVYPNPVTDNIINVSLNNMPAGVYAVKLYNTAGQLVYVNMITHSIGSTAQTLRPASKLAKGAYQLEVINKDGDKETFKLIVK